MADISYSYLDRLNNLELSDLELLSEKINTLICYKKRLMMQQLKMAYPFLIEGAIKREIDIKKELSKALD